MCNGNKSTQLTFQMLEAFAEAFASRRAGFAGGDLGLRQQARRLRRVVHVVAAEINRYAANVSRPDQNAVPTRALEVDRCGCLDWMRYNFCGGGVGGDGRRAARRGLRVDVLVVRRAKHAHGSVVQTLTVVGGAVKK